MAKNTRNKEHSKNRHKQHGKQQASMLSAANNTQNPWRKIAIYAIQKGQWDDAETAIRKGLEHTPEDAQMLQFEGQMHINRGQDGKALIALQHSLDNDPTLPDTHFFFSYIYKQQHQLDKALASIDQALQLNPNYSEYLFHKSTVLAQLNRHTDALALVNSLLETFPDSSRYWNNAGILYNALGSPNDAQHCFNHAIRLEPNNISAFSNLLTSLHYDPVQTQETIFNACLEWERRSTETPRKRPTSADLSNGKTLRVGMISDGFRIHPVGRMIIAALERLPKNAFELYAYSSCGRVDPVTERFKAISHYHVTIHMSDAELAEQIRQDEIDILIDLAGYNNGSRVPVLAMQPAPVQVKWVGGLINTTGLSTVDYLITDSVESPYGDDAFYTEKLIRMPNDYICYEMPEYTPEVAELPSRKKGFITLGCFNNPMKINPVVLEQWALIMHALPQSVLFLKGAEYNSDALCEQTRQVLKQQGIDHHRIIIEGFSPHNELLACYNRVDIALDPWPYSGGLTTCEAFSMGVPVVTMPGPTFAGRHSATHLVNAGMPELVTNSWDEYRERVLELASDLDSLTTIRSHLRTVLLQSPVCDAETFAGHLNNALRAIWQRYTENKAPAALSFNEQGEVLFEDEHAPVELHYPEAPPEAEGNTFNWTFDGRVIAIDHGAQLLKTPIIKQMLDLGTLELVVFDPASNQTKNPVISQSGCHYYPNMALGNGKPATLYACQSAQHSGTLEPAPAEHMQQTTQQALQLLAQLPVATASLDTINELPSLDWLVLDDLNDSLAILENGQTSLADTLLIHTNVAFQPTHVRQPNFTEMAHWASRNGFRFYCFADQKEHTPVPQNIVGANRYSDELVAAAALFIPDHDRMHRLNANQRMKLAFIADSVYGLKGLSYDVLGGSSHPLAEQYIHYTTEKLKTQLQPKTPSAGTKVQPRIVTPNHQQPSAASSAQPTAAATPAATFDWGLNTKISVVDIGANPIDGTPPYRTLLDKGHVRLVGFEPQSEALKKLNRMKGKNETYLPHAVGDGQEKTLYLCHAEGMTSTLEPNFELLNRFQGYPIWAQVKKEVPVKTHRLDDINEIKSIDWLKIDIQGGELSVFKNAEEKLKNCLVIQTEVNFISLYKNQPLFADIDAWMRKHGFMLHTLLEQRKRLFAPMVVHKQIHQGINQLTTADAVYVLDFDQLQKVDDASIMKLAYIMHEAYGSYDYALNLYGLLDKRNKKTKTQLAADYLHAIKDINISLDGVETPSQQAANMLLSKPESYLKQVGWLKSILSRESVTADGVVPWVTYPFIHFFNERVKAEFSVFEYGSGNSTIWLSQKVKKVVSVEHDENWFKKIKTMLPSNVDYIHHPLVYGGDYGREVLKPQYANAFDIAFVDGRDRVNCLRNVVPSLKDGGVVILDNAERSAYDEGSNFLLSQGFKRIDFTGMGPINIVAWSTAVFYRENNCLGL
ncbi:FkbM family methyltransferase [Marinobacterium halophilum]|uniref:protein O-GlcNAc transferase n=1 Tax=Marinobacterium halophilum TaxID=267374 RepID=A0A2P8ESB1_9GAMM|nr:FkbM family methyltransferase [Marinobacterium halophilum]PSL12343.1 FkbM family methyltransferase [Marinobacterium halophilum]